MTDAAPPPPRVLCFGEILWDVLPAARHPGGAPFNVAYHLSRHGCRPLVVSAVGCDELGGELLSRLDAWGIDSAGVRVDGSRPTGVVLATPDAADHTHYEIARDVAWDEITPAPHVFAAAREAAALVFGSLAQRSAANLAWLEQLLAALPPAALRAFDVNLRAPHDSPALVARLARHATLLKLNAAEAARLHDDGGETPGREESDARVLAARWGCGSVVVTAGARGAGWLRAGAWHWEPARPVAVADTIGAGDAFLAALLAGILRGSGDPAAILAQACRTGEWVATQAGATPAYDAGAPR